MKTILPVIDENWNINVHNQEEITISMGFFDPNTDTPIADVSTKTFIFQTRSGLSIELVPDPDDVSKQLLNFDASDAEIALDKYDPAVIIDTTSGARDLCWEGLLVIRGW